jgi:hypothetical protein
MMTSAPLILLAAIGAASALLAPSPAHAQDSRAYPNRPIKVIVPFPPGGPTDGMARIISERLGALLGQSIVVENRGGGAGGSIGAKVVANADPDGYTILMTPGGSLTTGPAVNPSIGYDPAKVFLSQRAEFQNASITMSTAGLTGLLIAGDALTGQLQWFAQLGTGDYANTYPLAVNSEYVFVAHVTKLHAFHRYTGVVEFVTELGSPPTTGLAVAAVATILVVSTGWAHRLAETEPERDYRRREFRFGAIHRNSPRHDFRCQRRCDTWRQDRHSQLGHGRGTQW